MSLEPKFQTTNQRERPKDLLIIAKVSRVVNSETQLFNLIQKRNQNRLVDGCVYRSNSKVSRDNIMKILKKENSYSFDSIWGYDRMIVIVQDNSSLDVEDEEIAGHVKLECPVLAKACFIIHGLFCF